MSYPSLDSISIFLKSEVTVAIRPVCEEYSLILFASAEMSLASILAFIETASVFLPFKSNVKEPLTPSSKGPSKTFVFADTFTPVPATITPAGLELDPDTPATLEENSKTVDFVSKQSI